MTPKEDYGYCCEPQRPARRRYCRGRRCIFAFKKNVISVTVLCEVSVCFNSGGTPQSCFTDDEAAQSRGGGGALILLLPVVAYCTRSDIITEGGGGEPHVHELQVHSHQPQHPSTLATESILVPLALCVL